jgi:hypothetical protein
MPIIPTFGRWRQEEPQASKFWVRLGYKARHCLKNKKEVCVYPAPKTEFVGTLKFPEIEPCDTSLHNPSEFSGQQDMFC